MSASNVQACDVPSWTEHVDNPYLQGIHAPTTRETTAFGLPVVAGEVPRDLFGAYFRNGPNQVFEPTNLYHWFDGDGMVHGVYFRDGEVGYRSRFVRTVGLDDEMRRGAGIWPGVMGPYDHDAPRHYLKDTANTDVLYHNGHLLALWYLCGTPYRLDPLTLDARGSDDFGGKLTTTVSAHPKVDERTGELVYFTLSDFAPPYMTYGVVGADGVLAHEVPIDIPGPRAPHDITITERYSILHDLPFYHDAQVLKERGYRVARFHRDEPSRYGVIPRRGGSDEVKWFEFEPGYVLHMVNAWEDGDWIVMDGCFEPDPTIRRRPEEGDLASMLGYLRVRAHLHRWRMNLVTGECHEEALDDLNVEFPLPDTDRYGVKTRYSYHQHLPEDMYTVEFRKLVKYDHETGRRTHFDYGPGWYASESPFARRLGGEEEDDGYVVTIVTNADELRSECWVFAAQRIEDGPIARVALPSRVPTGFHAKWVAGERIWGEA
ncbi:MAG: carotenoid oxygenase family protein [Myxococcota bacterium]|nr:carotenoid oxygenase family protein [Myxococcota bacterium]